VDIFDCTEDNRADRSRPCLRPRLRHRRTPPEIQTISQILTPKHGRFKSSVMAIDVGERKFHDIFAAGNESSMLRSLPEAKVSLIQTIARC